MQGFSVWMLVFFGATAVTGGEFPLERIELPPGFHIEVFAGEVPNARQMALAPGGTLFVGSRSEGKVHAVIDSDGDYRADKVWLIDEELPLPSGIAFRDGSLYVGSINRILRYDDIEARLDNPPEPVTVIDSLPREVHHGWKYLKFGPDGKLYIPVGAPCNICKREEEIFASISRANPDGSGLEVFAHGVRNSVGFDFHPETGVLWFTDNGRDMMGDDIPPDELNRAPEAGMNFGYPHWHGKDVADPEFGKGRNADEFTLPVQELGPHVAALGMIFYRGDMFPPEYRDRIFIAEHGSWNRSKKIGYRVTQVRLEGDRAVAYEPFAHGWLQGEKPWGRPADVLALPDGSILVADDLKGAIYRIVYRP